MQDKTKVTLYLPPDLHRQLKIRAAVEAEPMSLVAEKALIFYLTHPGVVDELEMSHGRVHQIYNCPECASSLAIRDGEMVTLGERSQILPDDELSSVATKVQSSSEQSGEQELVPC